MVDVPSFMKLLIQLGLPPVVALLVGCGGGGGGTSSSGTISSGSTSSLGTASSSGSAPSGHTITASSASLADVQAAVNAAKTGDTVVVPAGDAGWGSGQLLVNTTGIHLRGASSTTTTIRRTGVTSGSFYLIQVNVTNVTISDLHLVGNLGNGSTNESQQDWGVGFIGSGAVDFQVYNCVLENFAYSAVSAGFNEPHRGIIFKNKFLNNYNPAMQNLGYGVMVIGKGNWPALSLGTAEAVFVEDNEFVGSRHDIASNNGSRYVFRHNVSTVSNATKDYAKVDAHGYNPSNAHGSRSYEIYENTVYTANDLSGVASRFIGIRGGDGVVWNNRVAASNVARIMVVSLEDASSCGTYPFTDQIRSLHYWGNTEANHQAQYSDSYGINNECPSSIQLGRDYFVTQKAGYTPYTYPHPARAGQ
jgi:hypothetical protein